ncbi:MAG TPA: 2-hydroxyacyl-CoA dehydratase [Candidatus Gastranaerophilales bacterium]|nr:2-hydroxyacyl-CoA dehydratase [Candidatus Gastranaerophilales bacterium]
MPKSESEKERIISFPQMGSLYIPVCAALEAMGAKITLPPPNNKKTLSIGARYSPESICLPYKLNLGNYIQALEQGANTIIMFQAPGTCRLGNYAKIAELKLKELGYDFEMIVFDLYKGKFKEIIKKFNRATGNKSVAKALKGIKIGLAKFNALDKIERELLYLRPREIISGEAQKTYIKGRMLIQQAKTVEEASQAVNQTMLEYKKIIIDKSKDVLKIFLTGEFFVLLDTFVNMDIEKELGILGVEVDRQIMLSEWASQTLIPKWLRKKETHKERCVKTAKKYLTRIVGGECVESVGDAVYAAEKKVDGVIHVAPFNCIPEIISQCILPQVSKKEHIPVISLLMDEHTGKAGLITRLEAFVDLMRRNKQQQTANLALSGSV